MSHWAEGENDRYGKKYVFHDLLRKPRRKLWQSLRWFDPIRLFPPQGKRPGPGQGPNKLSGKEFQINHQL